jgi:hypothetical protein
VKTVSCVSPFRLRDPTQYFWMWIFAGEDNIEVDRERRPRRRDERQIIVDWRRKKEKKQV